MNDVIAGNVMPSAPCSDVEAITTLALSDLLALRGARIFITGGTGYIGRWLLESLLYANSVLGLQLKVTVLSRRPKQFSETYPHLACDPSIRLIEGDVRNFAFIDEGFSHVVHAATDVIATNAALEVFDVTVNGTQHVLEFARSHGVGNVLILSSGAVYGPLPDHVGRASESLPCACDVTTELSAYGLGKIATEWLANSYGRQYGFSCKTARVYSQIGPYLELGAHFAAGNFIRDALRGEAIIIKGDGTSRRSYMYSIDMVSWLWAILVRGKAGLAYNVGSEQEVTISDLAESVVRVAGSQNVKIKLLGQSVPGVAPSRYVPDTKFAREELGLSITVPFDDALSRTLEWFRAQIKESKL